MIDRDLVFEKVSNIRRCLRRIKQTTSLMPDSLTDINVQDIFVLNLQRAVQSVIDLAAHVVTSEDLGLPASLRDNFRLMNEAGIIDEKLKQHMESMVGFRNIAVHEYQKLENDILGVILTKHLTDLEDFYKAVIKHYQLES